MKYIKIYEDKIMDPAVFFKDKIDWKFYNYLLGKITEFEDSGFSTLLDVVFKSDYKTLYYTHYMPDEDFSESGYVRRGNDLKYSHNNKTDYESGGLCYGVCIMSENLVPSAEQTKKFINKIKDNIVLYNLPSNYSGIYDVVFDKKK